VGGVATGRGGACGLSVARRKGALVVRVARSLHLSAIAAFALAVVALLLERHLAATVLFFAAAAGFLATLILQRVQRGR
jgi:hypothetical protein